jgi:superfamily II RNA helicase
MKQTDRSIAADRERLFAGIGVPKPTPFVIDDFQQEALDAVAAGHDVLVVAPTGAGKTFIATDSIRLTMEANKRAVYTTPLKALSNTKYNEFRRLFEPKFQVGILTGDRKIDGDAGVVIATTEIYRNELYSESSNYGLVVLDEVHFLSDPQRGPVWEESIILTPSTTSLLMLSASISNAREVADWIQEVRGKECRVVTKVNRPVELRFGFLHPDLGIIPLRDAKGAVLKEVVQFYAQQRLDGDGMRVSRGRGDAQRGRDRGGRSRSRSRGGRRS